MSDTLHPSLNWSIGIVKDGNWKICICLCVKVGAVVPTVASQPALCFVDVLPQSTSQRCMSVWWNVKGLGKNFIISFYGHICHLMMVYNSLSVNPTTNFPQLELHLDMYSIRFKYSCQNLTLVFSLRTALHNSWLPLISHQFPFKMNLFFSNNNNNNNNNNDNKVYLWQSVNARAVLQ